MRGGRGADAHAPIKPIDNDYYTGTMQQPGLRHTHPSGARIRFCVDDLSDTDCRHVLDNAHELASVF